MKLFGKPKKAGDFSEVDTMDKVMEYVNQGILAPLYLMPLRFNGEDSVSNRVFVPTVVVELKDRYEKWYEIAFKNCDGLWIGKGVSEQTVLKTGSYTREMQQAIKNDFGYVFVEGETSLVKYIDFITKEDEVSE